MVERKLPRSRIERDTLGEVEVPADALYGAQTARAVANFPVSGWTMPPRFIAALAHIKGAFAGANAAAGLLPVELAAGIAAAAGEIVDGEHGDQFPVDVFQTGSGTSTNMNLNEVIAHLANLRLGGEPAAHTPVHPNDHVNMGQSTNDVVPTAMRIAALLTLPDLIGELRGLARALDAKASEFASVAKSGRTHLQDAVPVTLGQEFGGYAACALRLADHIDEQQAPLRELGIGGSAAGTGLNTKPGYRERVVKLLSEQTGLEVSPSANRFEAMQSMAPFVRVSAALRTAAVELGRISNDLRLLASGPTTGLAEIRLPAVQPGSSIMPGKINPVVPECMNMICFQVAGNDTCIANAAAAGQMELNVMMPIINYNLLWSIEILTNGVRMLRERCVEGIEADAERCAEYLASTLGLATVLNPVIGYHAAAEIAKEAAASGKSIRETVLSKGIMSEEEFDQLVAQSLGRKE